MKATAMRASRLSRVVVALVSCSACSNDAVVHVAGEPHLAVIEGAERFDAVWITPALDNLTEDNFRVEVDPAVADRFTDLAVHGDGAGGFQLHLQSSCDLATAAGAALVPITVRTEPRDLAAPVAMTLAVQRAPDANACRPQVRTWIDAAGSDCTVEKPTLFALERNQAATLCASFTSQDPTEAIWLRLVSTAPAGLVGGALPCVLDEDLPFTTRRCAIPIVGNRDVVGIFKFPFELFRRARPSSAQAISVLRGTIQINVGIPDDVGVEVTSVPAAAPEFGVSTLDVLVHYYRSGPGLRCSLIAERSSVPVGSVPRAKPFLRLYDAAGAGVDEGQPIDCSEPESTFTVKLSPPVDAAAVEGVTFRAFVGTVLKETRSVPFAVSSFADHLVCGAPGGSARPSVACADVNGDGTPEIAATTALPAACVFSGTNGRIDAAPVSFGGPAPAPTSTLAVSWAGPMGPTPIILGRFEPGPDRVRRLLVGGGSPVWDAAAVAPLGFVDNDDGMELDRAQPLAAIRGAPATDIAYLRTAGSQPQLAVRCLCVGAAPVAIAVGNPGDRIESLGRADLDGDGDDDLVAALRTAAGLDVYAVTVDWSLGTPVLGAPSPLGPLPGASTFAVAGVFAPDVFAIDDDTFGARLREHVIDQLAGVAPVAAWGAVFAPGATRSLAEPEGRLVAGLANGLWEYRPATTSWMLQDPVLREVAAQPVGDLHYARALTACVGVPGAVFSTTSNELRYTRLDVVLGDP